MSNHSVFFCRMLVANHKFNCWIRHLVDQIRFKVEMEKKTETFGTRAYACQKTPTRLDIENTCATLHSVVKRKKITCRYIIWQTTTKWISYVWRLVTIKSKRNETEKPRNMELVKKMWEMQKIDCWCRYCVGYGCVQCPSWQTQSTHEHIQFIYSDHIPLARRPVNRAGGTSGRKHTNVKCSVSQQHKKPTNV